MQDENWDDPSIKDFTDMQKYAFITQRALENDFIGFCYRESSEFRIDSGWRFIYGDEDENYLDNPDNTITKDLSEVLAWKPELKNILSSRRGSQFEWDNTTNQFTPIED